MAQRQAEPVGMKSKKWSRHIKGMLPSWGKSLAAGVLLALTLLHSSAFAEEDCFNGPVAVNPSHRGQINVPPGHAVRLTFSFYATWENQVFVCDALSGQRILVKGNFFRDRTDWISPIDNTRSLTYYVVAFHKMRSPQAPDAFRYPWLQSPMKRGPRIQVAGESGAYVDSYGFNDGGGDRWDNALVTAYIVGAIHGVPPALPTATLQSIRGQLH